MDLAFEKSSNFKPILILEEEKTLGGFKIAESIQNLARKMNFNNRIPIITCSDDDLTEFHQSLSDCQSKGYWLIIQNIHLTTKTNLQNSLNSVLHPIKTVNPSFRLWIISSLKESEKLPIDLILNGKIIISKFEPKSKITGNRVNLIKDMHENLKKKIKNINHLHYQEAHDFYIQAKDNEITQENNSKAIGDLVSIAYDCFDERIINSTIQGALEFDNIQLNSPCSHMNIDFSENLINRLKKVVDGYESVCQQLTSLWNERKIRFMQLSKEIMSINEKANDIKHNNINTFYPIEGLLKAAKRQIKIAVQEAVDKANYTNKIVNGLVKYNSSIDAHFFKTSRLNLAIDHLKEDRISIESSPNVRSFLQSVLHDYARRNFRDVSSCSFEVSFEDVPKSPYNIQLEHVILFHGSLNNENELTDAIDSTQTYQKLQKFSLITTASSMKTRSSYKCPLYYDGQYCITVPIAVKDNKTACILQQAGTYISCQSSMCQCHIFKSIRM